MQTSLLRGLPGSVLFKRVPLLLGGAIVPLLIAAIMQPAVGGDTHGAGARGQPHQQSNAPTQAQMPVDVPRGDLRSDIMRNAQSHSDMASPPAAPRPRNIRDLR